MANYWYVIIFSLIGGVFSLIAGLMMLSRRKTSEVLAAYATPFAAGALLAAVFMDLLKEGIEEADPNTVLLATMTGLVIFFFAERFLRWFHHHHQHDHGNDPTTSLIVVGDTLHNALDGVAIAAAFLVSVPTGIVTTMAVAAHEIPQEVGDFGLLLSKGMKPVRVLAVNIMSALATTVMAVLTFSLGSESNLPLGWIIGLSAGFLLYIATSDIIPEIHEKANSKKLVELQPVLLLVGVVTVTLAIQIAHGFIDAH
jgi:zinc and cadmium transporter